MNPEMILMTVINTGRRLMLLIALELLLDEIGPVFHGSFFISLLLLELICAEVQGQQQEVDGKAHDEYGKPCIIREFIRIEKYDFKQRF